MAIKHRNKIILGIGLGIFVALLVAGYHPRAHFFSGLKGKTAWDWLSLAGVPVSLAGLGFWLQLQQQKQNDLQKERELRQTEELAAVEREQTKELAIIQREQTEKLATIEQGIAEQNRQEEALENYFDKVSALLVEKNLLAIAAELAKAEGAPTESDTGDTTTPDKRELLDVSVDVIRARTLTTLRKLDSSRKTSLIRFLLEAEVISKLQLSLAKADLSFANLEKANLSYANLEEADLRYANLEKANLSGANLEEADLSGANLKDAILISARLEDAQLKEAELLGATLKDADLTRAVLTDANLSCDLSEATLNDADLTRAEMEGACLSGVFLKNAILVDTILAGANLSFADLNSASMTRADLTNVNLTGADLKGAFLMNVNLEGADLSGTEGLTKEQLEGKDPPYLCDTKLPEDIDIDPNRDCERLKKYLS